MQKWEYFEVISIGEWNKNDFMVYYVQSIDGKDVRKEKKPLLPYLNQLGEEGWELVAYSQGVYTFKRPKPE